jgi:ABC-type ATPase involved in cell division
MSHNHLITISDLTWGYDDSPSFVFDHFDFHLDKGEFVVLSGKSGAGKSSLVKLLLGQESAPAKSIYHRGEDISKYTPDELQLYRRNIGVVFQDYKLLEWLTAKDNILYPLRIAALSDEEIQAKYEYVVDLLHLHKYIDEPVKLLSGGHKQKVAIARALINHPEFIMADEPTGNLDREDTKRIADVLLDLHAK